jgi:predicted metal-binding transcription factor (methanogenesis marker protein 9)
MTTTLRDVMARLTRLQHRHRVWAHLAETLSDEMLNSPEKEDEPDPLIADHCMEPEVSEAAILEVLDEVKSIMKDVESDIDEIEKQEVK